MFVGPKRASMNQVNRAIQRESAHMSELVFRRSKGQSLMEYALLFALITGVVIITIILLGPQLASEYQSISNAL